MFTTIYKYELKHWLRQPSVYIYAVIVLLYSMFLMQGMAGGWDPPKRSEGMVALMNSPLKINWMLNFFMQLMLVIVPAIIGSSIYRDFKSHMHSVLYSYPFQKAEYLLAKFLSAMTVVMAISLNIGIGMIVGTQLPGINTDMLAPLNIAAYAQNYLLYIFPSLLLFGTLIFTVVGLTRNIYAGFITLVLLYFVQGITGALFSGLESGYMAAISDPLGKITVGYATRYWTLVEQNTLMLPTDGVVLHNRLLWTLVTIGLAVFVYRYFEFSQNASSFLLRRIKPVRMTKSNFGSITRVSLSRVGFDYSLIAQIKTTWKLSNVELKYIMKSWMFLSLLLAGILMVFLQQAQQPLQHGFNIKPVTWTMLKIPTLVFSGVINLLTFLYAGMLVQRARLARANQLVDSTPIPNWSLMLSKFIALLKMQLLLLSLILIGGIATQISNGYYNFEVGLYLFSLYAMNFLGHAIWALVAIFVQTLFTNPYLGLFLLIGGGMGIGGLKDIGLEHQIFHFNVSPFFTYSDMNGHGNYLPVFYLYKSYWTLLGVAAFLAAALLWIRGLPYSFRERLSIAKSRFSGILAMGLMTILIAFFCSGATIYYADHTSSHGVWSAKGQRTFLKESDRKYKKYVDTVQPKIVSVKTNMNLFPDSQRFQADGEYWLVNKSDSIIDTLLVSPGFEEITRYEIHWPSTVISTDSIVKFDVYELDRALLPGDSLRFSFDIRNTPNTFFRRHSNVLQNGTFIGQDVFPRFHYRTEREIPLPSDSSALGFTYQSLDSDAITFEATVSTSVDQIAIAPGYLEREWQEDGRRNFHYRMDHPIKFNFGFNSARFEVRQEAYKGVDLEIYYHKGHDYNLDRMFLGLKAALDYQQKYFSPYQYRQARIIEFPVSEGTHATVFANSIPFSEYRFIADVDDSKRGMPDMPFYVAAHELAHQWWGSQVVPANTLGARMVTESLAEYSALKMLRHEHGNHKMRKFLRFDLEAYLRGRRSERKTESPLIHVKTEQQYISYAKGSLAFYALSDFIGEEQFNEALRTYLDKVKFQEPPYTTSIELLDFARAATPDSLQYLIEDMFETITLYDNWVKDVSVTTLADGRYQVDIEFMVSKHRSDGNGNKFWSNSSGDSLSYVATSGEKPVLSLPLADYIEIGLFTEGGDQDREVQEIYLRKHLITDIHNTLSLVVDQKPEEVGVDPYFKLIDSQPVDNIYEIQ